ncbi:MAG: flavodoxin FldA [Tannerella sp.]|jgi:flavodoxin I|nr:flavodoxin FldA [Tannerella sp.]
MDKTAIIYGSSTGMTEDIAKKIASQLNVSSENVYEVAGITPETVSRYDALLLGSSTWGSGELQDDWYDGVEVLKKSDLTGKKISFFGTGDSYSYSDTFCDALGLIYGEIKSSGAIFTGQVDPSDYTFDDSVSVVDGKFVGLALDETNEADKTDGRIDRWIKSLVI